MSAERRERERESIEGNQVGQTGGVIDRCATAPGTSAAVNRGPGRSQGVVGTTKERSYSSNSSSPPPPPLTLRTLLLSLILLLRSSYWPLSAALEPLVTGE